MKGLGPPRHTYLAAQELAEGDVFAHGAASTRDGAPPEDQGGAVALPVNSAGAYAISLYL